MRRVSRPKHLLLPSIVSKDRRFKKYASDIIGGWDIRLHYSALACKTLIFRTRKSMHEFHDDLAKRGIINHGAIPKTAFAFVAELTDHVVRFPGKKEKDQREKHRLQVDPNYFAICCFVEGDMDIDKITHESIHVAYAYGRRVRKNKYFEPGDHEEEAVCYPAGVYARQVVKIISREAIRAIGGDSKKWRDAWDKSIHMGYLHHFCQWAHNCPDAQAWLERYRLALTKDARSRKKQA